MDAELVDFALVQKGGDDFAAAHHPDMFAGLGAQAGFKFSNRRETSRQMLSFLERGKRRRIDVESAMRIPDLVLEKLRELPPDKQQAVLEFVESLQQNGAPAKPLKGFEGLLEKYNVQITEEDIAEAPREMWGNFPRDVS